MKKNNLLFASLSLCACLSINAMGNNEQLDQVTVISASGFEQNIAQAPASISVITALELEKKGYTDILDAVKNIPGVFVSNSEINIRGMRKEFTLYLVDGKPLSTARTMHGDSKKTNGQIGISLPNIDMIERIEIIRGPMSSLYGSEAMGGVINIITKKVVSKWNGSISAEYTKQKNSDNSGNKNLSVYLNGPIISDTLSLSINALKQKSYGKDKKKIGGKLSWNLNDTNNLGLEYAYSKQIHLADEDYDDYGIKKGLVALTHEANYENLILNSYLQLDKTQSISGDDQKEEVLTFNTQGSYFFDKNTTTFGFQYKKEVFSDAINELAPEVDRWLSSLFLENVWSMTDDFSLTTGLRYNYDEFFKGELSPRIYGVYNLSDNITLKGGVSTGYKQPGITTTSSEYGTTVGRGRAGIEVGNPDLKPEESLNYEIGANYSLAEIGINSSIMIFKTDYKNKFVDEYTCGFRKSKTAICEYQGGMYNFVRQQINVHDAEIKGLELTFDYKIIPSFTVSSNYSYTKSKQKTGDFIGSPLNKLPKHMYNVNLDWQSTSKFNTWAQYNYRGRTSEYLSGTSLGESTPSYAYLDLGFVYKASDTLRLKAAISNLLNKKTNDEDGTVLDNRRVTLGLNYKF